MGRRLTFSGFDGAPIPELITYGYTKHINGGLVE